MEGKIGLGWGRTWNYSPAEWHAAVEERRAIENQREKARQQARVDSADTLGMAQKVTTPRSVELTEGVPAPVTGTRAERRALARRPRTAGRNW